MNEDDVINTLGATRLFYRWGKIFIDLSTRSTVIDGRRMVTSHFFVNIVTKDQTSGCTN